MLKQQRTSSKTGSDEVHRRAEQKPVPDPNAVWQSLALRPGATQTKLAVSQSDDPNEREADHIAAKVMQTTVSQTAPGNPAALDTLNVQRSAGPLNTLRRDIALRFGVGEKLPGEQRAYFEPRFNTSLDHVRLHDDAQAHATAASLNARAWTLGADVFFARGHYAPGKPAGQQLLAHELTHVTRHWQQPIIHRNGNGNPTAPPPERLDTLGRRLSAYLMFQDNEEALTVALQMIPRLTADADLTTFGIDVIIALMRQNRVAEAEALLPRFDRAIRNQAASGVDFGSTTHPDQPLPRLVRLAEGTARGGDHVFAARLFRIAFLALQAHLIFKTRQRDAALGTLPVSDTGNSAIRNMFVYPEFGGLYDMMRNILGFYHRLERERPEITGAALGFLLHREISEHDILSGESARTMTAEVAGINTRRGPGLRIFGANNQNVDVTRLPGTDDPREVGAHSFQHQELGRITEALYGQVEFMHEIEREPEVRREFGSTPVDMNNMDQRIRLWRAMYRTYQTRNAEGALRSLMELIGRYLRAFTIHTMYNIRDWGTSYLDTPEAHDLAGRAERDCGVYALTVAYEVYRTARAARPRLDLTFQLIALPEHVALVIHDRGAGGFYVVNNDEVSMPLRGNELDVVRSPIRREY